MRNERHCSATHRSAKTARFTPPSERPPFLCRCSAKLPNSHSNRTRSLDTVSPTDSILSDSKQTKSVQPTRHWTRPCRVAIFFRPRRSRLPVFRFIHASRSRGVNGCRLADEAAEPACVAVPRPPEFDKRQEKRTSHNLPCELTSPGSRFICDGRPQNVQGKKRQKWREGREIETEFADVAPENRSGTKQWKKTQCQRNAQQLNREPQVYKPTTDRERPALPMQQSFHLMRHRRFPYQETLPQSGYTGVRGTTARREPSAPSQVVPELAAYCNFSVLSPPSCQVFNVLRSAVMNQGRECREAIRFSAGYRGAAGLAERFDVLRKR